MDGWKKNKHSRCPLVVDGITAHKSLPFNHVKQVVDFRHLKVLKGPLDCGSPARSAKLKLSYMIKTVVLLRPDLNAANSQCAFIGTKKTGRNI